MDRVSKTGMLGIIKIFGIIFFILNLNNPKNPNYLNNPKTNYALDKLSTSLPAGQC